MRPALDLTSLAPLWEGGATEATIHGCWGASKALVLSAVREASARPLVVVTPTPAEAEALARDLRFFAGPEAAALFPDRDVLPYQPQSPDPEVRAERLAALHQLLVGGSPFTVLPVQAALDRLLPPETLRAAALPLYTNRIVARDAVVAALLAGGYARVGQVTEPGECSVRGGICDFYPPGAEAPVRIEFIGDEIHSLRHFDPDTQRSLRPLDRFTLLPISEVGLTAEACTLARERLAAWAGDQGAEVPGAVWEALERRAAFPGIENLLGAFTPSVASVFDFLAAEALVVLEDGGQVRARAEEHLALAAREADRERRDGGIVPPAALRWVPWAEVEARAAAWPRLHLEPFPIPEAAGGAYRLGFQTKSIAPYRGRVPALLEDLRALRRAGTAVALVARSPAQATRIQELLKEEGVGAGIGPGPAEPGALRILVGDLSAGFHLQEPACLYLTEGEVFGPRLAPRRRLRPKEARPFADFAELKPGDYVVHVDHGIGQFEGLEHLSTARVEADVLALRYAGTDRLLVPIDKLHLVQRYVGADATAPALDKLGGTSWQKAKERVRAAIREMAGELLQLYAARQVLPGTAFGPDTLWQAEFEAAFPYDETPDQFAAIQAVKRDMEAPRPMDRLVCGDVGYGKTEVALRAAFKAVLAGKQVAVLVPTTVLALQHHATFAARFAPFPVAVEVLSRFRNRTEQQGVVAGLRTGTVDIVIGTHRLLSRDITFRDLGLLVVDEEHRFGVAAKERLKQLRREVDALTLTATPIPRTLHMAMLGVRDVSTIETPPEDRLSIRTYVTRFDAEVLREAIDRELARGGQVFFVHNRVETIQHVAGQLKAIVPHARIAVGHGQQSEEELERVMVDFYARKYDLLCCTTIIESGLDIPAANTIIIDRADTLGLAQLYQLRGRVGRDRHRAYAYLLIPEDAAMTDVARRRLQVIAELTELGSGFKVAARDLEIRGAGNLLGAEQHGHIGAVGFELYCQLIESTMRELKGEPVAARVDPTIAVGVEAFLPEAYVPDATVRLGLYKRIASAESLTELREFRGELEDRFGELPREAEWLLRAMELKLLARPIRAREVEARNGRLRVALAEGTPVDPAGLVALVQRTRGLRLRPPDTLELVLATRRPDDAYEAARALLTQLAGVGGPGK